MKTSQQQFEMLLTFMEQHGDISNPVKCAKGRVNQLRLWEDLTALLNSEGSGDTKSTEKWKKVWSDYKSNTKKKAARLHKAAGGTGGGPAILTKLTDLECRTLSITGIEAATGLQVEEAGFSQEQPNRMPRAESAEPVAMALLAEAAVAEDVQIWSEPGVPGPSGAQHFISPAPIIDIDAEATETAEILNAADQQEERSRPYRRRRRSPSPEVVTAAAAMQPNLSGQTTPRRRAVPSRRGRGTPRRVARQVDQVAERFINSDAEWRQFRIEQHQENMELRRETNRIREMEIQTTRNWQEIGNRALDLIEKLVDKYCKK